MTMRLAVGATSRRLVQVAAELGVHQIVASHAQVKIGGGYTGMDQTELVALVRANQPTTAHRTRPHVVRDHGHVITELEADIVAGFDGLHLDVESYADVDREDALRDLGLRFASAGPYVELGGEHMAHDRNLELLRFWYDLGFGVVWNLVLNDGTFTWADRQVGRLRSTPVEVHDKARQLATTSRGYQPDAPKFKLHNCDWIPYAMLRQYADVVSVYNVAPELGRLETDVILMLKTPSVRYELLSHAYGSGMWRRWCKPTEGSADDRARCALRYLQVSDPFVRRELTELSDEDEAFVRGVLREWISIRLG